MVAGTGIGHKGKRCWVGARCCGGGGCDFAQGNIARACGPPRCLRARALLGRLGKSAREVDLQSCAPARPAAGGEARKVVAANHDARGRPLARCPETENPCSGHDVLACSLPAASSAPRRRSGSNCGVFQIAICSSCHHVQRRWCWSQSRCRIWYRRSCQGARAIEIPVPPDNVRPDLVPVV